MPNALVIERDRAAISPAARYRRASRTASIAASYSRCTSSSGSAESTRFSRYASCAFCHILVLPTPSHRQLWQLPYASAIARLQILRQPQHVIRRDLRNHVLGLTIDHSDHHALRLRVFLKHQVVLLPEHFRSVQRLDGLNHFAVLRSFFDRNGSRYRWQILRNAIQCGDIHNVSSGKIRARPRLSLAAPAFSALSLSAHHPKTVHHESRIPAEELGKRILCPNRSRSSESTPASFAGSACFSPCSAIPIPASPNSPARPSSISPRPPTNAPSRTPSPSTTPASPRASMLSVLVSDNPGWFDRS